MKKFNIISVDPKTDKSTIIEQTEKQIKSPIEIETNIFTFRFESGLVVLAFGRIIDGKAYISYCYAESQKEVDSEDLKHIDTNVIQRWCERNHAVLWSY